MKKPAYLSDNKKTIVKHVKSASLQWGRVAVCIPSLMHYFLLSLAPFHRGSLCLQWDTYKNSFFT